MPTNSLTSQLEVYRNASGLQNEGLLIEAEELFFSVLFGSEDDKLKAGAHFHLGQIALGKEAREDAFKHFFSCLLLDRTFKKAYEALDKLPMTDIERTMLCHVERRFEILNNQKTFVPLGHFYSPIPDYEEIKNNEERIFSAGPRTMSGIDLREHEQFELLQNFQQYYNKQPFSLPPSNLRYFIGNSCYSHSDAIFLLSMICDLKPQRIIEVGSGFSSCAILDINELYFHNKIECTFIEPYPDRFLTLIRKDDSVRNTIIIQRLQDIPIAAFKALVKNDILFIDSTHVVKTFSDVHYLFSTILPNLNVGVHIHFHDIFYPFEYPKAWVYEGRGWNEAYFLRAFLQFNNCFEVTFFSTFLIHYYEDWFKQHMPLCIKDKGGGSLWIKKVGR